MKVITWNCQGAFREKIQLIAELKPDVALIQECESPDKLEITDKTLRPMSQSWYGDGKKGIGVFSFTNCYFETHSDYDPSIKYVVPITVSGAVNLTLIAVWTREHEDHRKTHIGQAYLGEKKYGDLISQTDCLFMGDFNSNMIWHDNSRIANFSDVAKDLEDFGLTSLYHQHFEEKFGEETKNTFYMNRKKDKAYHIDYCFASRKLSNALKKLEVSVHEHWCHSSDHCPLIVEFEWDNGARGRKPEQFRR